MTEHTDAANGKRTNTLEAPAMLEGLQQQLAQAQTDFTRITHNVNAAIENLGECIRKERL